MSLIFRPQTVQTDLQFHLDSVSPTSPALPQSVKPRLRRYDVHELYEQVSKQL